LGRLPDAGKPNYITGRQRGKPNYTLDQNQPALTAGTTKFKCCNNCLDFWRSCRKTVRLPTRRKADSPWLRWRSLLCRPLPFATSAPLALLCECTARSRLRSR
jgi:hypothetical protein